MIPRTRLYVDGALQQRDFPAEDVSDHIGKPGHVVWVDLVDPDPAELELLAAELDLHELALEDALSGRQRPKLDHYPGHLFLSGYHVTLDDPSCELISVPVVAFVTPRALVTVHGPEFSTESLLRRWDDGTEPAPRSVGALLHGLLDVIVDSHLDAVQRLDEEMAALEDLLFAETLQDHLVQRRTFELRKTLVLLRRVAMPMREVTSRLMRRDLDVVDDELMPFFLDVHDHVLRATEWAESLRDLVTTLLDTHLTMQGNRLNAVMKKVTGWAAVIAVPTAVTGFYGQNVPYPGFGEALGFRISTLLIVALSALLYGVFRVKDWI